MRLNRSNHGAFVIMYTYMIGAKQWSDLVESDEPVPREQEAADEFS